MHGKWVIASLLYCRKEALQHIQFCPQQLSRALARNPTVSPLLTLCAIGRDLVWRCRQEAAWCCAWQGPALCACSSARRSSACSLRVNLQTGQEVSGVLEELGSRWKVKAFWFLLVVYICRPVFFWVLRISIGTSLAL